MSSERLTNDMREVIVRDMRRHRFADEVTALFQMRAEFAQAVYEDVFDATTRKKMAALPAGWLPETDSISAQFGVGKNRYEHLYFNGVIYGELGHIADEPKEIRRRTLASRDRFCTKSYTEADALSQRYTEVADKTNELLGRVKLASRQATAAIAKASTTARLKVIWPETAPFITRFDKSPPQLPSLPRDDLNHMFRLPVAEAAE